LILAYRPAVLGAFTWPTTALIPDAGSGGKRVKSAGIRQGGDPAALSKLALKGIKL
jgi:hypothetical protein